MFNKVKTWLIAKAKATLLNEIKKLDRYEIILANQIRVRLDPAEKAKQVVAVTQTELTALVNKVFSWNFLHTWIFGNAKEQILEQISKLSNYEDDLTALLARHLDADAKAKLVVDYIQEYITSLVNKYIPS